MTAHASDRMRRAAAEALALILPVRCAGCDTDGIALCGACRAALAPHVTGRPMAGFVVHAGVEFAGIPARVIRAVKEDGRTGLAGPLAVALRAAARAAVTAEACAAAEDWIVVCVPTSRAAMRRRGFRVGELLARRADLGTTRLLVPGRASGDQRGLDRASRARNVAGSMRLRTRLSPSVAGRSILLIDDVVTTGATLAEARRLLLDAGAARVAVAAVASTPRRGVPISE